jgi:hypothetical protein
VIAYVGGAGGGVWVDASLRGHRGADDSYMWQIRILGLRKTPDALKRPKRRGLKCLKCAGISSCSTV